MSYGGTGLSVITGAEQLLRVHSRRGSRLRLVRPAANPGSYRKGSPLGCAAD